MAKIKIPNAEVQNLLSGKSIQYPKYATQIVNLANQNAQGTRPKIVGQLSDLIQQFEGKNLGEWEEWYLDLQPTAIDDATEKIYKMVELLKESIEKIDKQIVKNWVEDLVITKTFTGLKFQEAILKKIAEKNNTTYRLSTPIEESQGIDGYIGDKPVSIKPITYKAKLGLNESIKIPMIYYDKKKTEIVVEYDFEFRTTLFDQ